MGTTSSNNNNNNYEATREKPLPDVSATLYYFEGKCCDLLTFSGYNQRVFANLMVLLVLNIII